MERADFERSGLHAKEWGKGVGPGWCISGTTREFPVFLIAVFPKNEKENLSMAERNALRTRANSIFEGIL